MKKWVSAYERSQAGIACERYDLASDVVRGGPRLDTTVELLFGEAGL
jgi:hypothetical protein